MKKYALLVFVAVLFIAAYSVWDRPQSPEETVRNFYNRLVADETGYIGNGEYRTFPELTPGFIGKIDILVAEFDTGGYDPFLCAQDKPGNFTVEEEGVSTSTAGVIVKEDFSGSARTVYVDLVRDGRQWKIADISCGGNTNTSTATLNAVGDYVSTHISELSSEKETVGGKFFITAINFNGDEGVVNYEDGHNAYAATFDYAVDGDGVVTISNFTILDEPLSSVGGTLTGNLVRYEGAKYWSLIYEEPGKPALTKELIFAEKSSCVSEEGSVVCSGSRLTQGDRVRIQGKVQGDVFIVDTLIKL